MESLRKLFTKEQIKEATKRVADSISKDFEDEEIVIVCILKGSFIFTSDLLREIVGPRLLVDFIKASSYGSETTTSGKVTLTHDLETDIEGKNVIIVEDIIDSGITLAHICGALLQRKPRCLRICALVDKRAQRKVKIEGDYVGLTVDDGFLVGYGMDCAEQYRNLPDIFVVEGK
jgi:hypoxanthine phosphoribosyltransferase